MRLYRRKVASGRKVVGTICSFTMPVLMNGSETVLWNEKKWSRIRAAQMDNLRGLLGIRRSDKVLNAWIRELYRVTKGVDEGIDVRILRWFGYVEKMKNDRIGKRVYLG